MELDGLPNESENEIMAVAEFHAVINSILEMLDDSIRILKDVGTIDLSNGENCSAAFSDQRNVSHDSGKCSSMNDEFINLTI